MKVNVRSGLIVVSLVLALAAPVALTAYLTRDNGDGAAPPEAHDLRLANLQVPAAPRERGVVSVEILDQTGQPVTGMVRDRTKLVHLYLVRRDLTVFQHLYPRLANGTWSTTTTVPAAGPYRVIVEFTVDAGDHNDHVILGDEAIVPGPGLPGPKLPAQTAVGLVVEGADDALATDRLRLWFTDRTGGAVRLGSFLGAPAQVVGFHGPTGAMVRLGPTGEPSNQDNGTFVDVRSDLQFRGPYLFFVQVRLNGKPHTVPVTANIQ